MAMASRAIAGASRSVWAMRAVAAAWAERGVLDLGPDVASQGAGHDRTSRIFLSMVAGAMMVPFTWVVTCRGHPQTFRISPEICPMFISKVKQCFRDFVRISISS